jgi:hypothetical protein
MFIGAVQLRPLKWYMIELREVWETMKQQTLTGSEKHGKMTRQAQFGMISRNGLSGRWSSGKFR